MEPSGERWGFCLTETDMQKGQSNQQSSEKDLHGHMRLQGHRTLHDHKRLCSYGKHESNELLEEMCSPPGQTILPKS
jgi:hypothetical protein